MSDSDAKRVDLKQPHYPESDFAPDYPPERPVRCGSCGWAETFKDTDISHVSARHGFWLHNCPKCDDTIMSLTGPTYEEVRAEAERGNPNAIKVLKEYENLESRFDAMDASQVNSIASFPEMESAESMVFVWDNEENSGPISTWVIVRIAGTGEEICREAAYYEGAHRFQAIRELLAERYGASFKELVPTSRSLTYLYGDDLSGPNSIGDPRLATDDEAPWATD